MNKSFVMRLAEDIPRFQNYKLFYNYWFFSIGLAKKLKDEKIHSLSTVRPNRLKGCKLKEENQLKMKVEVIRITQRKQKKTLWS